MTENSIREWKLESRKTCPTFTENLQLSTVLCVENFKDTLGPFTEFLVLWKRYSSQGKSWAKAGRWMETDELCKILGDSFVLDALACAYQETGFEK